MKKILSLILLFCSLFAKSQYQATFFDMADRFFNAYTKDGRVNYTALRENPSQLNELVKLLEENEIEEQDKKAYLINAYNILVINQIVKHPKPVDSPLKINGFFETNSVILAKKQTTLNAIENEMIRPRYQDPRVHFVLVCAGLGCPPIAPYAYRPQLLEKQLKQQTELAMNNEDFIYVEPDKKANYISQIFEWYQSDFGKDKDDVIAFINSYRKEPLNPTYKVKYYEYDWQLNEGSFEIIHAIGPPHMEMPKKDPIYQVPPKNELSDSSQMNTESNHTLVEIPVAFNLQTFTAGSLLGKGKMDFTLFNTLYTESENNWEGVNYDNYRATFVTHLLQFTYGISKSQRINVGLDINFKSSGRANNTDNFAAIDRAFAYKNNDSSRVGIASIGARIRLQPFKAVNNFTLQSTLSIPTIKHPEGFNDPLNLDNLYWADWDRITWWNQFFYTKDFRKFQLFTEIDFLYRFARYDSQRGMLDLPASVFLSYFPTSKITLYAMTQHLTRLTNNINDYDFIVTDWVIPANYTASGMGLKYQFSSNLNVELLYTNFWRGTNSGTGNTFNIGLKYITR